MSVGMSVRTHIDTHRQLQEGMCPSVHAAGRTKRGFQISPPLISLWPTLRA